MAVFLQFGKDAPCSPRGPGKSPAAVVWNEVCLRVNKEGDRCASLLNAVILKMKMNKSAAKAALKPIEKPTVKINTTSAASLSAALTTIDVKLDVGFGNAVYLRGEGGDLTWERGLPLVCVDAQTWRWSGLVQKPITFKLLINDKIWSAGNDLQIAPGQKMEVAPADRKSTRLNS